MRLVFLTINGDAWGGSEVLWVKTAKLALEEGHDVLVSMFDFEKLPEPIEELRRMGAEFYFRRKFYPALPERVRKKMRNKLLPEGKKTTYHDYILNYKADRVLFNLGGGDEIARDEHDLLLFVKQTNIKYSVFCHSISLVPDTDAKLNKHMRLSFEMAEKVFFTSKMQVEMLRHQLMYDLSNAVVSTHPVNIEKPGYIEFPETSVPHFALVGALTIRYKGQDIALKAFSGEAWKDRDFVVNVYGAGSDESFLKQLVNYYGLEDKVRFCGYGVKMEQVWKDNQIMLLPSRQDSGPITLFEAMCCGRPVVGTRMGAIPDYVENGVNGLVCEPHSYSSFADALEAAWQQKDKWEEWGKASWRMINERYDFHPEQTMLKHLTGELN